MTRFRDRTASILARILGWKRAGFAFLGSHADVLVGGAWFVAVLTVTLWMWGLKPVVFPTPDEAVNRLAALMIRKTGSPLFDLPFADPEDLAHMRPLRSMGERAVPLYPPVTFYFYGLLTRLGRIGYCLIAMLPAGAAAAFAMGTAELLPPPRRWLALAAPALGFPGLYWLLRPWMNISLLLVCLCWSLFFWAHWRRNGRVEWLAAALLSVGAAAAVRPDYASFLLAASLLFSIAAMPSQWKVVFLLVIAAGACAVGVNLVLNQKITGDPWRAAYQMVMDDVPGERSHAPFQIVRLLLFPGGLPTASDALTWFTMYWLKLGPIPLLVFGQLALVPLLRGKEGAARMLYAAGLLVVLLLALTRMYEGFYGAADPVGLVNHSIPRYWAPVYLFAALPPIVFLGHCRARAVLFGGSALAFALVYFGVREIYSEQPTSFRYIESSVRANTRWLDVAARSIPAQAIVYSEKEDRLVWSRWHVGLIRSPEATITSMRRALAAGRPVFIVDRRFRRGMNRQLEQALKSERFSVVRVDARSGIYRVRAPEPET